jgi:pimeloyl-ACP methyl ester carboxylesterase
MTDLAALREHLNRTAQSSPREAGRAAFPLFVGSPPRLPVRPAEQPVHEQATASRLVVDGKELAVYRWGDGERKVLLLHGFEGRASNLVAFAAGLRDRGLTAIAFDNFGHGESEGNQATIVDVAGAARAVAEEHGPFHGVVAHSFGGLCAYHAVRTGLSVRRMVTIGAVCDFDFLPAWFGERLGLDPSIVTDLRRRSEEFFLPETDIWERFSASYAPGDWTVPLLVIHDENDKEIAVAQGRKIAGAYPDAEYLETRGLGHRRILGDAGVVTAALEFVAC